MLELGKETFGLGHTNIVLQTVFAELTGKLTGKQPSWPEGLRIKGTI